jgi:hypothetical protein
MPSILVCGGCWREGTVFSRRHASPVLFRPRYCSILHKLIGQPADAAYCHSIAAKAYTKALRRRPGMWLHQACVGKRTTQKISLGPGRISIEVLCAECNCSSYTGRVNSKGSRLS